ncbi:30S ribosomal protein S20 [Candidatus Dojkabacteria bacterium]|nr:30S ribosomal protein S20 [Candidatus Dojkabacteria bacterium]
MANTKSAKKAIRSSARKKSVNDKLRDRYKKARKEVREAIEEGDKEKASELLPNAMKQIDKAAKKNVLHKNTASRYKSRLSKAVNKLE